MVSWPAVARVAPVQGPAEQFMRSRVRRPPSRTFPCPTAGLPCNAAAMPGRLSTLSFDKCTIDRVTAFARAHEDRHRSELPQ
jgi:hypothetical protein